MSLVNRTNQCLIQNIQDLLDNCGWKIPQLAKATGLSASGLYGVMDGSSWPGPDNLERIAKALKTTPSALLLGENEDPPEPTAEQVASALAEACKIPAFVDAFSGVLRGLPRTDKNRK